MTEHQHQAALFQWLELQAATTPALRWAFAIPNGGYRDIQTGRTLKAEGVKAGCPDIFLPLPCGKYAGLFIEMKDFDGKPTKAQKAYIKALNELGYRAVVCKGWDAAKEEIESYLRGV